MAEKSGFEALLEAMRKSGADIGGGPNGSSSSSSSSSGGNNGSKDSSTTDSGDEKPKSSGFSTFRKRQEGGGSGGSSNTPPAGTDIMGTIASWGKKKLIIALIVLILILLAAYWWFHPAINIHSSDMWVFLAIFVLLPAFLVFRAKSKKYESGTKKVNASEGKAKRFKYLSYVPVGVIVLVLIGGIMSLSIFPGNAEKYSTILKTQNLDFSQDIQEVDYSQIPVIDRASAELLGDKEMGTISDYVSQFEISSLYSQINYQGSPVRVSPLGYADLFKWLTNRGQGIPAYAVVNMTTQDTAIVRISEVDGTEGQGIKYSASEPLARNIDRYIQLSYPFYMFDEKSFEIDDDGHPWWICPVKDLTIGLFGGTTISRVVLCDAVTGECQDYDVKDVPTWVDRVYPAELLIQQYNWYGAYNNGWFNSWLGQQGVVKTTPGSNGNVGYNYIAKDDDVWVYTGVTSATSDSSIIGFVLVNQRTAESHFYSISGATETSAMESAEGQVQNLRYVATFPILINVANQPTYFMALKDSAGLVKKFAMIDIQRYQNVAIGDTVSDCQKSYITLLATNGIVDSSSSKSSASQERTGVIARIGQAVVEGNSHYYVVLAGDGAIYDFALPGLVDIVRYKEGDTVSFYCIEGSKTWTVEGFK